MGWRPGAIVIRLVSSFSHGTCHACPTQHHSASIQLVPGKPGPRTPQSTSHPAASSAAIPSCCWPVAPITHPLAPRFLLLACSPQCSLATEPTSCGYDYHFPSLPLRANGHDFLLPNSHFLRPTRIRQKNPDLLHSSTFYLPSWPSARPCQVLAICALRSPGTLAPEARCNHGPHVVQCPHQLKTTF